jgi:hypothetical protein
MLCRKVEWRVLSSCLATRFEAAEALLRERGVSPAICSAVLGLLMDAAVRKRVSQSGGSFGADALLEPQLVRGWVRGGDAWRLTGV